MFHSNGYKIRRYNEGVESIKGIENITYFEVTKLNKSYNQNKK